MDSTLNIKIFTHNPIEVNCYVLYDETHEGVIIDPACFYPEEKEEIQAFIQSEGIQIKMLLNTHLHFDHCLGHRFCSGFTQAKLWANRNDSALYDLYDSQGARFGFRQMDKPILLYHGINEGDTIRFGNSELKALHVPGHSPGSICFYAPSQGVVFTGDALFRGSVGRTDLMGGSFEELMSGIKSKLLTLPDQTVVYPGHGESTTIQTEKQGNRYLR